MRRRPVAVDLFKGRHFDREIIVLCVRWYLSFKLSSRDLVQIMSERGIALAHTTILRWVHSAMFLNLKSAGTGMRAQSTVPGAVMRHI